MSTPNDPVCPACGEPVGATSTYCMHCDAEFDAPANGAGASPSASTESGDGWGTADADWGTADDDSVAVGSDAPDDPEMPDGSVTPDSVADYGTSSVANDDYGTTGEGDGPFSGGLLDVGSRLGAVALSVLVGLAATFVLVLVLADYDVLVLLGGLAGLGAIVGGGVVIWRQQSGRDAFADALYLTATALVVLPFVLVVGATQNMTLGSKLFFAVFLSAIGGVVALPIYVAGWWLQPDDDG